MSKEVTKEQIGSIVSLLVAGKVTFEDAKAFVDKYKSAPSKKKRKAMKPKEGGGGGISTSWDEETQCFRVEVSRPGQRHQSHGLVRSTYFGRNWQRHPSRKDNVQIDIVPGMYRFKVMQIPNALLDRRVELIIDDLAVWANTLHCHLAVEAEAIEFIVSQPKLTKRQQIFVLGSQLVSNRFMALMPAPDCDRVDHDFFEVGGLNEHHRVLLIHRRGGGEGKYPIG